MVPRSGSEELRYILTKVRWDVGGNYVRGVGRDGNLQTGYEESGHVKHGWNYVGSI